MTGHDLMAMFPPKSPHTVRMNGGGSSCNIFAQQERAFLHSSPALRSPVALDDEVTSDSECAPSSKLRAAELSTTAMTINGKCAVGAVIHRLLRRRRQVRHFSMMGKRNSNSRQTMIVGLLNVACPTRSAAALMSRTPRGGVIPVPPSTLPSPSETLFLLGARRPAGRVRGTSSRILCHAAVPATIKQPSRRFTPDERISRRG